jgi:hypothetical protein
MGESPKKPVPIPEPPGLAVGSCQKFTTPEMNLPTILSNIPNAIGFQGEMERWTMPSE